MINNDTVKDFISTFEEDLNNYIDNNCTDLDDTIHEMFNSEQNFKHCDPTTGQRVWNEQKIQQIISWSIAKLKQNSDRCSNCGRLIEDRDWLYRKSRGLTVVEVHHCIGYKCNKCKDEYRAYYVEFFEE